MKHMFKWIPKGCVTANVKHNTVVWSKEAAGHIFFTKFIFSMNFYSKMYKVDLVISSFLEIKINFWQGGKSEPQRPLSKKKKKISLRIIGMIFKL